MKYGLYYNNMELFLANLLETSRQVIECVFFIPKDLDKDDQTVFQFNIETICI